MVTIKLGGAAMNAMRDAPSVIAAAPGAPSSAAGAAKLGKAGLGRLGAMRGAEAEGGRLAVAGKGALARGAEVEGVRLVAATKMTPTATGAAKAGKALTLATPAKLVVTKAAATSAGLWGSGLGLGVGASVLGPLLVMGAISVVGFGIYVGFNHERA